MDNVTVVPGLVVQPGDRLIVCVDPHAETAMVEDFARRLRERLPDSVDLTLIGALGMAVARIPFTPHTSIMLGRHFDAPAEMELTVEPEDGAIVRLQDNNLGGVLHYERDDTSAASGEYDPPGRRWYSIGTEDEPVSWADVLACAAQARSSVERLYRSQPISPNVWAPPVADDPVQVMQRVDVLADLHAGHDAPARDCPQCRRAHTDAILVVE